MSALSGSNPVGESCKGSITKGEAAGDIPGEDVVDVLPEGDGEDGVPGDVED